MPLQGEAKKQYQKELMRKRRSNKAEGLTGENEPENVRPEMFEGKPRYLTLSDGQVWDRTYRPLPNKHLPGMAACNRAKETDLSRGRSKQRRLAMIIQAFDKDITGLDGKRVNLLSLVRYGVEGLTLAEIKEELCH